MPNQSKPKSAKTLMPLPHPASLKALLVSFAFETLFSFQAQPIGTE